MAMQVIGTLSTQGWITDSKGILARILLNYILTDINQSQVFKKELKSLSYVYQRYIHRPSEFASQIKLDMEEELRQYFQMYEVSTEIDFGSKGYVTVYLFASVVDNEGNKIGMGNISSIDEKRLGRVLREINTGYGDGLKYYKEYIGR